DEEQHVLTLIAEVFRDRQPRETNAGTRARRLVHLAVDKRAFRGLSAALLVHAGFDELVIEVVSFARALADAGEHRIAAVRLRDVVDELLDEHGLADARAAEQADLAAFRIRSEEVHDLDPGDENFGFRRLIGVGRRRLVNRALSFRLDRTRFVDRLADDVDDAPEHRFADGNRDRLAGVGDFL